MPDYDPCYNMNLASCIDRLNRYIAEMQKCQSSGTNTFFEVDLKRIQDYLADLESIFDWVEGQKTLDLPKTSPQEIALSPMIDKIQVDNEMVSDIVNYLITLRDEMRLSQSNRQSTGFHLDDLTRFRAVVESLKNYLTNHVSGHNPMDMPESYPTEILPEKKK